MATAKKPAPKAPAKAVKPVAKALTKNIPVKAPMSKAAKAIEKLSINIAKLTERKDKINADLKDLRDQRAALKAAPVAAAPVAPVAKVAPKVAAPKKVVKPASKK